MSAHPIGILGTGSYLPEQVLDNRTLAASLSIEESWIVARTGVEQRRIAAPEEATSDLAARAAERALAAAGVRAGEIDLIVVATSSPDWLQPATAVAVQARLGASRAAAFDLNAVCSGFVYALSIAWSSMRGNPTFRKVLVVGADIYSRMVDYRDRKTCVIFGDGAGAVVLGPVAEPHGIVACDLHTDGDQAGLIQIPAGGSRRPASHETVEAGEHFFKMQGRAVRDFVHQVFPAAVETILAQADLEREQLALVIPHQANLVMLEHCAGLAGLAPEQLHYTIPQYGNTGAASIPITLDDAVRAGRLRPGDPLLLVGFGGGMSWGSVALRWAGT